MPCYHARMARVTFNEEPRFARTRTAESRQGSIVGLMYKLGVAKTQKDATMVLGGVIAACVIVSATMLVFVQPHTDAARQAQLERDLILMNAQIQAQTHASH